ncbi:MAG: hypothetical protein HYU35_01600 [Parcubacteria group bacterium]|nr:hypothetical protein [Parcubacteria group bacterium]
MNISVREAQKSVEGTTLLETVFYVAVLAGLLLFLVNTLLVFSAALGQAKRVRRVTFDAETALERFVRESRLAFAVRSASMLDIPSSVLALDTVVSATDPAVTTKIFSVSGGRLTLQEGGGAHVALTSPDVTVSEFTVSKITAVHSEGVRVRLTLETRAGDMIIERTFLHTAALRGSYH